MSNLGFQWVYRLFNRIPDLSCERFFLEEGEPAVDVRDRHAARGLRPARLVALLGDGHRQHPAHARDGADPAAARARDERHPLLLVGGDIARMNPAALSPFVDMFALGDGERLVPRIAELLMSGLDREAFLAAAAAVPGFFVPAVHGPRAEAAENAKVVDPAADVAQGDHADLRGPAHDDPDAAHGARRQAADRDLARLHRDVPLLLGRVRDGAGQAVPGVVDPEGRARGAAADRPRTGLIATAVCDHPEIGTILEGLAELGYHIALSSIKIDAIEDRILEVLARQGEKALAIAPEAGNERLRRFINKKVSDEMLVEKARLVFARGFTRLKLYLQVGLPSETEEDVLDIVAAGGAAARDRRRRGAPARPGRRDRAVGERVHPQAPHALRGRGAARRGVPEGQARARCSASSSGFPTSSSAACPSARRSGRRFSPRWTSRARTSSRRRRRACPCGGS